MEIVLSSVWIGSLKKGGGNYRFGLAVDSAEGRHGSRRHYRLEMSVSKTDRDGHCGLEGVLDQNKGRDLASKEAPKLENTEASIGERYRSNAAHTCAKYLQSLDPLSLFRLVSNPALFDSGECSFGCDARKIVQG